MLAQVRPCSFGGENKTNMSENKIWRKRRNVQVKLQQGDFCDSTGSTFKRDKNSSTIPLKYHLIMIIFVRERKTEQKADKNRVFCILLRLLEHISVNNNDNFKNIFFSEKWLNKQHSKRERENNSPSEQKSSTIEKDTLELSQTHFKHFQMQNNFYGRVDREILSAWVPSHSYVYGMLVKILSSTLAIVAGSTHKLVYFLSRSAWASQTLPMSPPLD